LSSPALLRLLQLCSPALPIGAYPYSQGLEHSVEAKWVHDADTAAAWILGLLGNALPALEAPLPFRMIAAWNEGSDVHRWNEFLFASRASAELRVEDQRRR
jgi:urease accessory protein